MALLGLALFTLGLTWMTEMNAQQERMAYFPLEVGYAARYRITYGNGVQGWMSLNITHPDTTYAAPILLAGAKAFQQESVWTNWAGIEGQTIQRTDMISRTGQSLALTQTVLDGQSLAFSPPLLLWSPDLFSHPIQTIVPLGENLDYRFERRMVGMESVEVPAGRFKEAIRLEDETRLGDFVQSTTSWLAKDAGLVRSETHNADGSLDLRLELVQARDGPPAAVRVDRSATDVMAHIGQNPARTHAVMDASSPQTLSLLWSRENPFGVGGSAVSDESRVYFIDYQGVIHALDLQNGDEVWRFSTGNASGSTPALANGAIYVGSGDKHLYALDAATGLYLWSFAAEDVIATAALASEGVVYAAAADRALYALDASDGRLLWSARGGAAFEAAPALDGETLVGADVAGGIYAWRARDGTLIWETSTAGGVAAAPALSRGVAFVAARDPAIYAFDLATGDLIWRFSAFGAVLGGLAAGRDMVYATDDWGQVYALSRTDGALRWLTQLPNDYSVGAPLLVGDVIVVATRAGDVWLLDAARGEQIDHWRAENEVFTATPWWGNGRLFLPGANGRVYALETEAEAP